MFEVAKNIRPLLLELDELVEPSEPVHVDTLLDLTKKHSPYKTIKMGGTATSSIFGAHVAIPEAAVLIIFYRPCSIHPLRHPERTCAECRWARYIIAKELSHAFDCADELTKAEDAEDMLIKEIIKGSMDNKQAQADVFGSLWGVELLLRYLHREELTGAGALGESPRLTFARGANDYSYFADQFCIPPGPVELSFRPNIMQAMKAVRLHADLPVMRGGKRSIAQINGHSTRKTSRLNE